MIETAMKYRLFSKPFNILTISNNFELKNNNIIKKLKSFYMALIYCLGTNNKQNNLGTTEMHIYAHLCTSMHIHAHPCTSSRVKADTNVF